MMTPTTMTKSTITTATTEMANVAVASSRGGILVGCMIWEGVEVDAARGKTHHVISHTLQQKAQQDNNTEHKLGLTMIAISYSLTLLEICSKQNRTLLAWADKSCLVLHSRGSQ